MIAALIPTIREVQEAAGRRWGVPVLDILSQRRGMPAVRVRQVAMWLARHSTLHSVPEIGAAFGGRDHTTVLHAIKRVDGLMAADPSFASEIWAVLDSLSNGNSVEIRRSRMRLSA